MRSLPVALLILAGCAAVGPDYERPIVHTGAQLPEIAGANSADAGVTFTAEKPIDKWWEVFHDPKLDELVEEARVNNQNLRGALARVHIARSLMRQAFAPLLPNIGATGAYQYAKFAPNALFFLPQTGNVQQPGLGPTGGPVAPSGAQSGFFGGNFIGRPFQIWAGTADMYYELDLWGRLRRQLEAANAMEIATEEDRKNVEITLLADTTQAYFDLGAAESLLAISRDAVALRKHTLRLVKERVEKGFATELELRRAEAELASAEAQVPEAERRRAVSEHRLAILLGHMPDIHFDGKPPEAFTIPVEIPVGVPAELLDRRPDIRAAEARLAGSTAQIGATVAEFFPQLTVAGRFGYASLDFSKIAQPASQLFMVGPSLRIPIFEGGLTYARVLEMEARRDEALANYHQTVLMAFGEVADAVVAIKSHLRVVDRQKEQVAAADRAADLAMLEYRRGLSTFLSVLDAQRTLLGARESLLEAQRLLLSDVVQLSKALGGGWSELAPDTFQQKLVEPVLPVKKD